VGLSGDGGDELFGGYSRHFLGRRLWNKMRRIPRPVRNATAWAITSVKPSHWDALYRGASPLLPRTLQQRNPSDKLHKLAGLLTTADASELYRGLVSHWDCPESVVAGAVEPATIGSDRAQWDGISDITDQMMFLDGATYLPDDVLTKVDRASMGVSLEARVPMLDHHLVEFAWRVPLSMKLRNGQGKWLLRQVLDRYVPRSLVERPKMGFDVPIGDWLRGPLRDWAESLLEPQRLSDSTLSAAPIRQKWEEHLAGRQNWQLLLWDVLMYQAWVESANATGCE
jgi:asparagine synthase (glutamine-hydrolysing)